MGRKPPPTDEDRKEVELILTMLKREGIIAIPSYIPKYHQYPYYKINMIHPGELDTIKVILEKFDYEVVREGECCVIGAVAYDTRFVIVDLAMLLSSVSVTVPREEIQVDADGVAHIPLNIRPVTCRVLNTEAQAEAEQPYHAQHLFNEA